MNPDPIQLAGDPRDRQDVVIPVVREDWQIHKEMRETAAVRVHKVVHEYEELLRETLGGESVEVVRVPRNDVVTSVPAMRTEGAVTIIPVVKEFAVVTKELRVVEEIRITRTKSQSIFEQPVLVRAEEVQVERVPAGAASASPGPAEGEVLNFVERQEEAVVTKNARVVEEVAITTVVRDRMETVRETLRHTELDMERIDAEAETDQL